MDLSALGEARYPSPLSCYASDEVRVPFFVIIDPDAPLSADDVSFEVAGPREKFFFNPTKMRVGIVTCSGLRPGMNKCDSLARPAAAPRLRRARSL